MQPQFYSDNMPKAYNELKDKINSTHSKKERKRLKTKVNIYGNDYSIFISIYGNENQ